MSGDENITSPSVAYPQNNSPQMGGERRPIAGQERPRAVLVNHPQQADK